MKTVAAVVVAATGVAAVVVAVATGVVAAVVVETAVVTAAAVAVIADAIAIDPFSQLHTKQRPSRSRGPLRSVSFLTPFQFNIPATGSSIHPQQYLPHWPLLQLLERSR